jgi:hypothetical protein
MGQRVIYVMTHDSIGLGEDGPTHQPVEHLSTLRAIPNLLVCVPADAVETLECWQIALEAKDQPSILALSRQNLPALRTESVEGKPLGQGRLCHRRRQGRRRDDLRHRLRSRPSRSSLALLKERGHFRQGRLGALDGAVRQTVRRLPQER